MKLLLRMSAELCNSGVLYQVRVFLCPRYTHARARAHTHTHARVHAHLCGRVLKPQYSNPKPQTTNPNLNTHTVRPHWAAPRLPVGLQRYSRPPGTAHPCIHTHHRKFTFPPSSVRPQWPPTANPPCTPPRSLAHNTQTRNQSL